MDLKSSLNMAGRSLLNCFVPSKHYLPTFQVICQGEYRIRIIFHIPCHNLCRWWDAMLRLQSVTDFEIPDEIEVCDIF